MQQLTMGKSGGGTGARKINPKASEAQIRAGQPVGTKCLPVQCLGLGPSLFEPSNETNGTLAF